MADFFVDAIDAKLENLGVDNGGGHAGAVFQYFFAHGGQCFVCHGVLLLGNFGVSGFYRFLITGIKKLRG
ncbi:hypothetical protein ACFL2R_03945 [Patescibacteria group bacterium]